MDKNLIIELYKKQFKVIYLYLIKYGCSRSDAEDIVHESFIKAIEYMDSVPIKDLSSWLFKVSINNYKNKLKRKKVIEFISVNVEKFYEELIDDNNVEDAITQKEVSEKVLEVLKELQEEYRSLLIFKYEMDLSYKEISILLGIEENIIKTYLYRARNKFKKEWRKLNE